MAVLFIPFIRFQKNRIVFSCYTVFCFSMNIFGTFSGASRNGALSTSMQSAADTRDDETLLNATQKFDLNSALYNSMKISIETCRYLEMNNQFPISTQNKSLFLCMSTFDQFTKILIHSIMNYYNPFPYLSDVICLSEIKIKNSILANITLPGFEPIDHVDLLANAGGVGVYVANKFSVKILNKNELNSKCEDIWLQDFGKTHKRFLQWV